MSLLAEHPLLKDEFPVVSRLNLNLWECTIA